MSILFSDGDAYAFTRTSGSTGYGSGKVVSDTDGTTHGPRHEYWASNLSVGADTVVYDDTTSPSGDPISVAWERSFGSSIPSSSTIEDWIHDYYQNEIYGHNWPGLNLHATQFDPGGYSLVRNSTSIGHIDVYDYAYGNDVLTVEHWWLKARVGSPVLQRSGNTLTGDYSGSAPGSATSPSAPSGFTFADLIIVVVL